MVVAPELSVSYCCSFQKCSPPDRPGLDNDRRYPYTLAMELVYQQLEVDGVHDCRMVGTKYPGLVLPPSQGAYCATDSRGNKVWFLHQQLHRLDGPAFELVQYPVTTQYPYQDADSFHHNSIPEQWYQHGKLHRLDGPAWVGRGTGTRQNFAWYQHGELHREGGPAMRHNTYESWYFRGQLHRDDGPASECDGDEWFVHGQKMTRAAHQAWQQKHFFQQRLRPRSATSLHETLLAPRCP